jgi:hypothetical protein
MVHLRIALLLVLHLQAMQAATSTLLQMTINVALVVVL